MSFLKTYFSAGSTAVLEKYSTDQPRDENGRFAGAVANFKAPSHEEQDKAIAQTKNQLQMISDMTGGRGSDAFVLANGKPFYMNDKSFDGPRAQPKMCFMNATQNALSNPKLTYVEGQVNIGPLSIAHAWNVDEKGNVVDPTFTPGNGKIVVTGYFGVPFGREYLMNTMQKTGMYGIISHTNPDLFKGKDNFKKYSPDQERDAHGRWSSGGDSKTVSEESDQNRIRAAIARADADPAVQAAEHANLMHGDSRMDPGVLDANGHYTPEADAENRSIAESFMNPEAKPAEGEKPSAIFLVGKTGAGKTTTIASLGDKFPKSVFIAGDDIKDKISGYTPDQAGAYHERSCDIARNYLTPMAIKSGSNLVFDMTDNVERLIQTAKALQSAGYKVGVIHAHVSDATSAERVYDRFKATGRYIPTRLALSYGNKPKMAYEASKGVVDQWREYDTSSRPIRIRDSGGSGVFG